MLLRSLLSLCAFIPFLVNAQVNGYAQVTAISATTCTVGSSNETYAAFTAGKSVVLMQMQDDVIGSNTTNNSSFGDLTNIQRAGSYQIYTIASVTRSAGTLTSVTLTSATDLPFTTGSNSSVQLITYELLGGGGNYTTTANITAVPWNGTIGGVVAFLVSGTLTLQHSITANGAGFLGGARSTGGGGSCDNTTYIHSSTGTNSQYYAGKGEGIYKVSNTVWANARGKMLSGGGGGNSHNAGGGGGGNYSAGGLGGYGWGCISVPAGGLGGIALSSHISASRVFMGGGGGGGEGNNNLSTAGVSGGGIILIKADQVQTTGSCGGLSISANGNSSSNTGGNDGAGGAGAGGTIVLHVNSYSIAAGCQLTIRANGGNGGSVQDPNSHGGGGGGGQGAVIFSGVAPSANVTVQTISGTGGCNNNANPCTDQAAGGTGTSGSGIVSSSTGPLPIELIEFKAIPSGHAVDLLWSTASEHNNAYFTVERSADAVEWTAILSQPGAGQSQSTLSYTDRDSDPLSDISYYRLRQTDLDGTSTVSELVAVSMVGPSSDLVIFPHPANDRVSLVFDPALGRGTVLLLNELGQYATLPVPTNNGQAQLDVSRVPSGTYALILLAGGRSYRQLLVVQH